MRLGDVDALQTGTTLAVVVFSVILHEIAHGAVALLCGDDTAKRAGRLTLNPLNHIDAFGSLVLPLLLYLTRAPFMFGWAKPVPVDFTRLKRIKRDMALVALAGPATNVFLAVSFTLGLRFCEAWNVQNDLFLQTLLFGIIFNLSLGVFNMLPVLPMDGGRVLTGILPIKAAVAFAKTERYGMPAMIFLLFILPALDEKWDIAGQWLSFGVRCGVRLLTKLLL